MKYRVLALLMVVIYCTATVVAQKVSEKPISQWGKEDALKLINESPWAKSYQNTAGATIAEAGQVAREQRQTANSGGSDPRSQARYFGPPPIRMRLHSGLPLRQAIVRLQQIDAGYDKMKDSDKAAFDAAKKGFLDCSICKGYHVVTIYKDRDASGAAVEEGVFQGMTFEDLKGHVKLVNDKGDVREIVQFNPPKGPSDPAVMYFKRADDAGNLFLTNDSKDFKVVFSTEFRSTKNRYAYLIPLTMEFKVSKLIVGDTLMF